jgi:2-amino-4-hydroxy-6-hydroxymethyldihydropteridine diphosphokinase
MEGVGGSSFLNGAVRLSTSFEPSQLLAFLLSVEHQLGRKDEDRSGPRTIDLDLLLYGHRVIRQSNLCIPHPRMSRRPFVLIPLLEMDADLVDPVTSASLQVRLSAIGDIRSVQLYKRMSELGWPCPKDALS